MANKSLRLLVVVDLGLQLAYLITQLLVVSDMIFHILLILDIAQPKEDPVSELFVIYKNFVLEGFKFRDDWL